jgi:hypothetical protein
MIKRAFRQGYKQLSRDQKILVRDEIMKNCFWVRSNQSFKGLNIFYRKMRGDVKITELEIREIEKVFARFAVNPWTGAINLKILKKIKQK